MPGPGAVPLRIFARLLPPEYAESGMERGTCAAQNALHASQHEWVLRLPSCSVDGRFTGSEAPKMGTAQTRQDASRRGAGAGRWVAVRMSGNFARVIFSRRSL